MHASTQYNNSVATADTYFRCDLGTRSYNDEDAHIYRDTFGVIKNNVLNAFWNAVGLNENVNYAYSQAMMDSENSFQVNGRTYHMLPEVGTIKPTGGCFTFQSIA